MGLLLIVITKAIVIETIKENQLLERKLMNNTSII